MVSKKRHDEVADAYKQAVNSIVVGDPWKAETQVGPLSMKRQLDRVMGYLEKGRNEGATLVTGGGRPKDTKSRLLRGAHDLFQRQQRHDDRER